MTMQVYFEFGSDEIDLQADGCIVLDGWYPITPDAEADSATEKIPCEFIGTSALAKTFVQKLNRWFELGRGMSEDKSPLNPIWMYFAVDGTETAYRARVYDGDVLLRDNTDHAWRQGRIFFDVVVERDPFWEAETWTPIPLTNSNGTDVTTGLRVYACGDESGTSPNNKTYYAEIKAADVTGDMPGPAKLEMRPEVSAINGVYIGQCVDRDGLGFVELLEEMDDYSGGSKIGDAGCSGAYYRSVTIPTSWAYVLLGVFEVLNWPKRYFRFIGRFFEAPPAGTWVKIKLIGIYGGVLAETAAVRLSTRLMQDLGTILMPNYIQEAGVATNLKMYVYAYNAGAGTLKIDCVMAMGQESYAELGRDDTNSLGVGQRITEQWGERKSYVAWYDPTLMDIFPFFNKSFGEGIWLVPGIIQRLYFLMYNDTAAPITSAMTVKCWHRARKRAL